jgi:hypothetical protein
VQLDLLDLLGLLVRQVVLRGRQARLVHKVLQEYKVMLALQVYKELQVLLVLLEQPGHKDHKEFKVI